MHFDHFKPKKPDTPHPVADTKRDISRYQMLVETPDFYEYANKC